VISSKPEQPAGDRRASQDRIAAIGLLQSQDDTLHSRKLKSFDEPPFR